MKFSYEKYPPLDNPICYPTLLIKLVNPKTKTISPNYKVLIDSGASACVFHASIGESIGIDIASGKEESFRGVTEGGGKQFIHPVTIIFGGHNFDLEAGFSFDLNFPFGLLGQKGFFEKHRICFDLPVGDFEITPKER